MYFLQEMTVFAKSTLSKTVVLSVVFCLSKELTLKRESIRLYFGSGQVLVGLLDFKSSDGQRCPWWVRFPCTSANVFE